MSPRPRKPTGVAALSAMLRHETDKPRRMALGTIAMARSGDKGAHANIGVWVQADSAYQFLLDALTAEVVATHFAIDAARVVRYELANLRACNFMLHGVLGAGGGSSSLHTDAQAKAYGQALLRVELDIPVAVLGTGVRPASSRRSP